MVDFKNGLVRVIKPSGVAGNGFLVHDGLILTCAHVVAEALGDDCNKTQEHRPDQIVEVAFTFTEDRDTLAARVIDNGWFPALERQGGCFDIAVLRLEEAAPHDATALRLGSSTRENFRVRLKPFVPDLGRSPDVQAVGTTRDEFDELQINAVDDITQWIEPGVSGAPVFAEDDGELVEGMVVWRDKLARQAFLKPASVLRSILPQATPADASRFALDVDEDRRSYANRRLVGLDIFAPSQTAHAGEGIAVQMEVSIGSFAEDAPRPNNLELRLTPPRVVSDRRGFAQAETCGAVQLFAGGDRNRPTWEITPPDGEPALSRCNVQVDTPPLCRLIEPEEGEEMSAELVTYANAASPIVPSDDLIGLRVPSEIHKRFIERNHLREIGNVGEDGAVVLARTVSVVRRID